MKDEEMAEERKAYYGIDLCCYCRECDEEDTKPCQHKIDAMHGYKDGFLTGLKAGRPQWHDLRKDKNDLPKRDKDFVVKVTIPVMTHPSYVFATYYFDNKKWFSFGEEIEVIAWCEIPTFDKE